MELLFLNSISFSPINKAFEKTIAFVNKHKEIFSLTSEEISNQEKSIRKGSIENLETDAAFKEEIEKFRQISWNRQVIILNFHY